MGRYIDSDGYVWEGAVYNCLECESIERHPNGKPGDPMQNYRCNKYGLWENDLKAKYGGLNDENGCSGWRPRTNL